MAKEENKIPPPDIKTSTPEKPTVTTVDEGSVEKKAEHKEPKAEEAKDTTTTAPGGVETDLMKRFLGVLIDGIIAAALGHLVGTITGSGILSFIVTGATWLIRDSLPFLEGQSLGKKVMKTKAVKEDGSSLSGDWSTGALRNILLAIPFAGLVEAIVILIRKDDDKAGLRLGDEWAKTKVISVE